MTASSVLHEYPGPRPGSSAVAFLDTVESVVHDEVTDTLLRKAWTARAERELVTAAQRGDRPAVLLIDVDRFKDWNDSLGHLAGDRVLAEVVGALRRGLRHVDLIGRFGGDELAVMLADDHDPRQATEIAERLRRRVEALRIRIPAALLPESAADSGEREVHGVTVTIGAATPRLETTPGLEALLVAADGELCAAKAAGRNTVRAVQTPAVDAVDSGGGRSTSATSVADDPLLPS